MKPGFVMSADPHSPRNHIWRDIWRDFRAPEMRLLALAVALGVAALSAVTLLSDRLQSGMQRDAARLLGGDVVVVSDQPTPAPLLALSRQLGLRGVSSLSFPTMARNAQGDARLVALKSAQTGYPLKGQLRISPTDDLSAAQPAQALPPPGHTWVEPELAQALDLKAGDALSVGNLTLKVSGWIDAEPDRGAAFMNFAPRLFMNWEDVQRSGLIQPASRVTWRHAMVGPKAQVQSFVRQAQTQIEQHEFRGLRIETLEGGRPEMKQTLERAAQFLRLVALLSAVLCAVAVGLSARSFSRQRMGHAALLRVWGQTQRQIAVRYTLEILGVGLIASLVGLALGVAIQMVFVQWLAGLIDVELPWPGPGAVFLGLGVGLTLLVAFGLPPILRLAQVPPLRVIRRELTPPGSTALSVMALGLLGFAALMLQASQNMALGLIVLGGFAAAMALFAGLAWLALRGLRAMVNEQTAPVWLGLATRQMAARPFLIMLQVSAMALGWMALWLLVLLRTDLLDAWHTATPADAPNRFVINIQPEQGDAFQAQLQRAGVNRYDWYPMMRGRLTMINGKTVGPEQYADERAKRLVDREFNLSHSVSLPSHNQIVTGTWVAEQADGLSIEEGIAQSLGIRLGDRLEFDLAGLPLQARVTSIRHVEWTSMRANFFVLFPRSQMPDVPMTYLSAYHAPLDSDLDRALLRQFPNITQVNLSATLKQIQGLLNQVSQAVELMFLFALVSGFVVQVAVVVLTREERMRDHAVLRALGAHRQVLTKVQWAELAGTGALSGALAATMALGVAWVLARQVFDFSWNLPWWLLPVGTLAAAAVAAAVGQFTLRGVLRQNVMLTLRQSES
jgi:putative ABC transport system permease protein